MAACPELRQGPDDLFATARPERRQDPDDDVVRRITRALRTPDGVDGQVFRGASAWWEHAPSPASRAPRAWA